MKRIAESYRDKLRRMAGDTLLPLLGNEDRELVVRLAESYRFTFQEVRQVSQAARDLDMWQEGSLHSWWEGVPGDLKVPDRSIKKQLLSHLYRHLESLSASDKSYSAPGFTMPPPRPVRLEERHTERQILGPCPAYSEQTVCCGLHTLDAVRGCPFSCSYCTIQTFYGERAELEAGLAEKLASLELDPDRRYHIGTGQASDSLVWGNRAGILDTLVTFASANPNVLLELKSKSDRVSPLCRLDIPANVVCSWTLNGDSIIRNEEQGAASLERRLNAARKVADHGVAVGFHFHPMVYYRGWDSEYPRVVERVLSRFAPEEVSFVSMGSVTLIKPVVQQIRRRGGRTKILQMEMVRDHHGKLTYPDRVKLQLFQRLYAEFEPWHGSAFFYLCMEKAEIWRQVFGFAYGTNAEFERDFLDRCLPIHETWIGQRRMVEIRT